MDPNGSGHREWPMYLWAINNFMVQSQSKRQAVVLWYCETVAHLEPITLSFATAKKYYRFGH